MKKTNALLASVLLPLLSACGGQQPGSQQQATAVPPASASSPAASAHSVLIDVLSGDLSSGKPAALAAGQAISGSVSVQQGGLVEALDVQIGNYGSTSDGTLGVKVCEGDMCADGSATIAGSADNKYIEVPLAPAIEVTQGGQLHYTLTRVAGIKPFAIWTYADSTTTTSMPDGSSEPRAPKLGLRYKR